MTAAANCIAKFPLGQLMVTPNALKCLTLNEITSAVFRHQMGDWGSLSSDDRLENDHNLERGMILISIYLNHNDMPFFVITVPNRSVTKVVMPSDY
jgi:hypothetical protein